MEPLTTLTSLQTSTSAPSNQTSSLSVHQLLILSYIGMATSSLSIIGAGSIVLGALVRRRVCVAEVTPICQLSLADFLAAFFLLLGAALFTQQQHLPLGVSCNIITTLSAAFFLCTFLLTLTYAVEVYFRIKQRQFRGPARSQFSRIRVSHVMSVFAWLLPVTALCATVGAMVTASKQHSHNISLIIPQNHTCDSCLLMFHYSRDACWSDNEKQINLHMAFKLLFLIPLLIVILGNLIFYALALREFRHTSHMRGVLGFHEGEEERRIRNKTILYQLVFSISWLPSLVLGFISLRNDFKMKTFYWLYVLQMLMSPLQGFWNCIIYGWQRRGFTQALNEPESAVLTSTNAPTYSTFTF